MNEGSLGTGRKPLARAISYPSPPLRKLTRKSRDCLGMITLWLHKEAMESTSGYEYNGRVKLYVYSSILLDA